MINQPNNVYVPITGNVKISIFFKSSDMVFLYFLLMAYMRMPHKLIISYVEILYMNTLSHVAGDKMRGDDGTIWEMLERKDNLRSLPYPSPFVYLLTPVCNGVGTPMSFLHDDVLTDGVFTWFNSSIFNHVSILKQYGPLSRAGLT